MASTHYKRLPYTTVPSATLSNQPIIVYFNNDTDIGGRISSTSDLRFWTPGGTACEWKDINLSLTGGALSGFARVVIPTVLHTAAVSDGLIDVRFGGTPDVGAIAPSTTLSLTGLVGAWEMESINPSDWSGNGNNGTGVNGPITTTGKVGDAVEFDGVGDYVDLGNNDAVRITGPITVSAWVNNNDDVYSWNRGLVAKYTGLNPSNQRGFALSIDYQTSSTNPRINFSISEDGGSSNFGSALGTTKLNAGTWHHVVGTFIPGESIAVYTDGSKEGEDTISVPNSIHDSTENLVLGYQYNPASSDFYLDGSLDDVRIYNRAQSQPEITYVFNQTGSPGTWGAETSVEVIYTAAVAPIVAMWAVSAVTASYESELSASVIPVTATWAIPAAAVTASYESEYTTSVTPVAATWDSPAVTASVGAEFTTSVTPVAATWAVPDNIQKVVVATPFYPSENFLPIVATNRQWLQIKWFWGIDGGVDCRKPYRPFRCIVGGELDPLNEERPELAPFEPQMPSAAPTPSDFEVQGRAKEKALHRQIERAKDPSYTLALAEEAKVDVRSRKLPRRLRERDPLVKDNLITQVDRFRRRKRRH